MSTAKSVGIYAGLCAMLNAVAAEMGFTHGDKGWSFFFGLVAGTIAMGAALVLHDEPSA